jgi:hypothetical protein
VNRSLQAAQRGSFSIDFKINFNAVAKERYLFNPTCGPSNADLSTTTTSRHTYIKWRGNALIYSITSHGLIRCSLT